MKKISIFAFILILSLLLNCKKDAPTDNKQGKLTIITSLFPLFDFTRNICGDKASVSMLLPPGVEPHSYEPTPRDIIKLHKAHIFIYTSKEMEPWSEKIVRSISNKSLVIINAAKGITPETPGHGKQDPHIWLDPLFAKKIVESITSNLIKIDPANKKFYLKKSQAYQNKIDLLHKKIQTSLKSCAQDTIYYGGHFAFGYFAKRYSLKHISPYKNFAPDAEPAPRDMIAMIKSIKKHKAKYVFFQELVKPRIAQVISRETGAQLLLLHGAHNITQLEFLYGASYLAIMENNITQLKIGLECK